MKKLLKITGIAALAVVLVCNLEYALFTGDMKNTSTKAIAGWVDSGSGIAYCGSSPDMYSIRGTYYVEYNNYWTNWYSEPYVYVFQMGDFGTQCASTSPAVDDVPPYYVFPYQYVTAITGTTWDDY